MSKSSVSGLRGASALIACASLAVTGFAQSAATETPVELEKYTVTGSYIPFAADAPATPITVVTAAQIQDTGLAGDLLEVIRKTVPQFTGNGNLGSSNGDISSGTTGGGSALALRNTNTLVLVNGRRMAFAPVVAAGGGQFVDVNSIPVSAVERLEVLTDGASATYGSDAVAGVVNIILKTNYSGLELGGQYKHATGRGNWEERSARLVSGASNGKTSLTVSAEWVKSDPLYYKDRDVSSPNFGTPTFPGVVQVGPAATGRYYLLNPTRNAPPLNQDLTEAQLLANGTYLGNPATGAAYNLTEISSIFDLSEKVTMNIASQKRTFTAALEHKFGEHAAFFSDVLYSKINTLSQINAQPITSAAAQTHVASDPRNPFDITVRARNRFVDFPRQYLYDADSFRVIAGFRGRINEFVNYEVAADFNQIDQLYRNKNVIDRARFTTAIANGTLNLFAYTQDPAALASAGIFGVAYANNISRLSSLDGRLYGELPLSLPAGPVSYAVGAEMRKETLSSDPDLGSYTDPNGIPVQWDGANPGNPFAAERKIDSAFVQLRFPLAAKSQAIPGVHLAEMDVALRHDKYSDTEDPTVPKVLLRWLPFNDEWAVRATYSKSFTAPNLYQMFGPSGIGNTPEIKNFRGADGVVYETLAQFDQRTDSNPNLKPSKSTNYNFGLIWSPKSLKGLKAELGYFKVAQVDVIAQQPAQTVLQDIELRGTASPYASLLHFGSFNGIGVSGTGQVVNGRNGLDPFLTLPWVNYSTVTQTGIDLNVTYTQNTTSLGRFDYSFYGTWWSAYTVDGTETVGKATTLNGTIPDYLLFAGVDWSKGGLRVGVNVQHLAGVDEFVDNVVLTEVPSFTAFDVRAAYTLKTDGALKWLDGLTVRAGVNNVFDKQAPAAPTVFSNANADTATYYTGMIGRVYYIDATYKF